MKNKHENPLDKILIALGIIITIIIVQIVLTIKIINPHEDIFGSIGGLGGFIGGIIGTLVATIALIYIRKTYDLQEIELKKTREQLELQQSYLHKQQFESTFFKMLDMIHSLSKDFKDINNKNFFTGLIINMKPFYNAVFELDNTDVEHVSFQQMERNYQLQNRAILPIINNHKDVFNKDKKDITIETIQEFYSEYSLAHGEGQFHKDLKLWLRRDILNEQEYVGYLFREFFLETNSELGHFFRYINNTIEFAIQERKEIYKDEKYYINLIQAQLSNSQLIVLFYNCISPLGIDKTNDYKFKENLDYYHLFKNLQPSLLLDPKHIEYYPKTKNTFKFISI
ncbi:MAG: putative phage abortive infection protein [Bacteroidota bacterium]